MNDVGAFRPEPGPAAVADRAHHVGGAFDGSTLLFRSLRALGWGPLLNLGDYPLQEIPLVAGGLARFQRSLVHRAISLLAPRPGETILDIGCGRGWSTGRLASIGARATGLDLVEAHVTAARRDQPGAGFVVGDATSVPPEAATDGSLDAILCLETAFQIEPDRRPALLREASRLLRPGGRMVLVDFVWSSPHPEEIERHDPGRLVRDTWRFEQFEPAARYRERAERAGLRVARELDWSGRVTARFQALGNTIVRLGLSSPTRRLLVRRFPGLPEEREPWEQIDAIVRAHDRLRRRSRYAAMVLERPRA